MRGGWSLFGVTRRRIRFIEQMEQTECGLCCLAMVLSFYRCDVPVAELRDRAGGGRDGVNLRVLKNIAESLGLEAVGQRVPPDLADQIAKPAILHWNRNHFVVLEAVKRGKAYVVDPAVGRRVVEMAEFRECFSGICLTFKPTERLKRRKEPGVWREFLRLLWSEPWLVVSVLVWSLWLQVLAIATPMAVQLTVDRVLLPRDGAWLYWIAMALASLIVVQLAFSLLRAFTLVRLQTRLDWQLMSRFCSRLLRLPFPFFQLRSSGDLILRANSNVIVREILSTRTVTILLDGGMVILFLAYMLNQSPRLTGYVAVIGALQVGLLVVSNRSMRRLSQEEILRQSRASSYLAEVIRGIQTLKAEGAEPLVYDRWVRLFEDQLSAARRRGFLGAAVEASLQALRFAAPLVVLLLAAREVVDQRMTLGAMFAFYALAANFLTPLTSMVTTANQMVMMGTYFRRILDVLQTPPEAGHEEAAAPPLLRGQIELRDVSFRYSPYGANVVENVSLRVEAGQFVAIVGATGAGKSTLASLLIGLYQPTSGQILFDGRDAAQLRKSDLRRQMGIVTQHVHLFNGSVFYNIALHNPDLTLEDVMEAARLADIHDEIMQMPMKYETILSEEGSNLSGGQRQRLALARALAHRPAILLLDEASSALDAVTEERIHNNLDRLPCTRIVIAHRLSTVLRADVILVVDRGRVVEQGTHAELLMQDGLYARLYERQFVNGSLEGIA